MRSMALGYTLIEILVVLLIISIVTSVGLLSIRFNENKKLETFANELTQLMTLAEEEALLKPQVIGLFLSNQSLQFSILKEDAEDNKKEIWVPLQDLTLGLHPIPHNIQVDLFINHQRIALDEKINPQIIISTNGDPTPFIMYVGKKGERPHYAVTGDADGNVASKSLS